MHFSIVDDEQAVLIKISKMIKNVIKATEIEVDCYYDGETFLKQYTINKYDALFLDIDMPVVSGFDIAEQLRSQMDNVPIVYITGQSDLVYNAFRYKPVGFVQKKYIQSELPYAIESVLSEIKRLSPIVSITEPKKEGGRTFLIRVDQIDYIENKKHYLHIHLSNGKTITERQTLTFYVKNPNFEHFAVITNGIIVNLQHIKIIGDAVIFDNGTKLYITRRRLQDVLQKYKQCERKLLL